jgi:tetratricopeptide (TPR) repeat protein
MERKESTMQTIMGRVSLFAVVGLMALSLPVMAAGGGSVPTTDPADQAAEAYNRGIESRDKAWELEEEAAAAGNAKQQAKLLEKAQKQYAKAIRAFQSATESDPQMHQAYNSLGYALRKTGQYEDSLEAYNQALEIQPGYSEAIEYRAEAYLGLNRLNEVKEAYMQLFREDRERADELMDAMQRWVEQRQADPAGLDATLIEEFSAWVRDRAEVSGNTASLEESENRAW